MLIYNANIQLLLLYSELPPFPSRLSGRLCFLLFPPWGKACPASVGVGKGVLKTIIANFITDSRYSY